MPLIWHNSKQTILLPKNNRVEFGVFSCGQNESLCGRGRCKWAGGFCLFQDSESFPTNSRLDQGLQGEGVNVVCHKRSASYGGLWRYEHANTTTATRTTIVNSSKEMSAFGDFPAPSDYPNYFLHSLMGKSFCRTLPKPPAAGDWSCLLQHFFKLLKLAYLKM